MEEQNTTIALPAKQLMQSDFDMVIRPARPWFAVDFVEMWEYRELLYFLIWRDVKVRYKQTVFGVAWAVIQPLFTMAAFTLFFGRLSKMPSDGIPYPLFSFAGLVPWTFFATGLVKATESVIGNANLIKKVYFPRLLVPLSAVLGGSVDFVIALVLLLIMMPFFGMWPGVHALWVPLFMVLAIVTALGVGLWLSALTVQFRDVRHLSAFLVQLWMFCTPIVYPSSLLSEPWRSVYGINPMAGVVEGFRWALLDGEAPGPMVWVSAVAAAVLLVTGTFYFARSERNFADSV